eukprot:Em0015g38a
MADLESVLADVSYLMAMERSKEFTSKTIKKFTLPEPSVHSVIHQYLTKNDQFSFSKIYYQRMGAHYLEKFIQQSCPMLGFLKAIINYEKIASPDLRRRKAKEIYDQFVFANMLAMSVAIIDQVSENLKGSKCPPDLFSAMKEHLTALLDTRYMKQFSASDEYVRYCQWKYMELLVPEQISLTDFSVHRIIGRGGFGEVYGCRKDDSGKYKKRIKVKKGEMLALNEKNMLAKISSPFVVNLYYAFQTNEKLCFVLDLMNGGDLHYHLTQHGVFSEDEIRFYGAELILGLEHIHAQGIVYRDLKPSNILLDEAGHVRISDLGLACEYNVYPPSSSVGTHGYMAPEVIKKGVHYTFTADWFSLGCVLYKLFKGHSPFRVQHAKNKEEIDQLTLDQDIIVPTNASQELIDLLCGLLEKDPAKRLGCKGRGSEELKELPFFRSVNWEDVLSKKVRPPLLPPRGEVNAADAFDIGNFDDDETRGVKLDEDDQTRYKVFNLLVSDRWQAEMMEGIFDTVNNERDKQEVKEKSVKKGGVFYDPRTSSPDMLLQGYGYRLDKAAGIYQHWQRKYFLLYQNRLDWAENFVQISKSHLSLPFDTTCKVEVKEIKGFPSICVTAGRKDHCIRFDASFEQELWYKQVTDAVTSSLSIPAHSSSRGLNIRNNSSSSLLTAPTSMYLKKQTFKWMWTQWAIKSFSSCVCCLLILKQSFSYGLY